MDAPYIVVPMRNPRTQHTTTTLLRSRRGGIIGSEARFSCIQNATVSATPSRNSPMISGDVQPWSEPSSSAIRTLMMADDMRTAPSTSIFASMRWNGSFRTVLVTMSTPMPIGMFT